MAAASPWQQQQQEQVSNTGRGVSSTKGGAAAGQIMVANQGTKSVT
jgi:hypothetical protein